MPVKLSALQDSAGATIGQSIYLSPYLKDDLLINGRRYLKAGNIEMDTSKFDTNIFTAKFFGTLTSRDSKFAGTGIKAATYGNGVFVAVGSSGKISTSPDGITWTAQTPPHVSSIDSIAFGNGLFAILSTGELWTSPDGVTWTSRTSGFGANATLDVDFVNGRFLATANISAKTRVSSSPDGITWTLESQEITGLAVGIAYGNGIYILVTSDGNAHISTDALLWVADPDTLLNNSTAVVFGAGIFLVCTSGGTTATSPDGITWTAGNPSTSNASDAYFDGLYLVCGNNERVDTSTSGNNPWVNENSGAGVFYRGITSGGGVAVVVGDSGMLLSAPLST